MTVKEWAAEYRRINEWEEQDLLARLPQESAEDSVRAYFGLCATILALTREAEEAPELWEVRVKDYEALAEKWRRLAHWRGQSLQNE